MKILLIIVLQFFVFQTQSYAAPKAKAKIKTMKPFGGDVCNKTKIGKLTEKQIHKLKLAFKCPKPK